jgi:ATPase subunit of ABC transporter with duplicated ATPase domains
MNRVVTRILEIDAGELTSYTGDYEFYERERAIAEQHQQSQFDRQQAMLKKELAFIERFKARASHAAQVQSRVKKLDKIEKVQPPQQRKSVLFEFRPAPRSGDDVVKLSGVRKAYGDRVVYGDLDFLVRRGERWCVLGANGSGKSTLLKLVAGESAADTGTVALGASVKMGYFAQHAMELLDPQKTVWETLQDAFPRASVGALRTLAGCFGFSGDAIEKSCRVLSGGERARLVLATLLFDPPNFLVLDEPTNHLDLATKEMLITALSGYEGAMLFVSHDRRFLGALSNRVLELAPEGPLPYGGGYHEYVSRTGREAPGLRAAPVEALR